MALTFPQISYNLEVTAGTNDKIDFKDAGTTYAATLTPNVYTPGALAPEVQRAMRAATGNSNQTATFSFTTLKFTLSGTSIFELLWGTGANAATDCNGLLGFAATNETAATSYSSDAALGTSPSTGTLWTFADPVTWNSPVTAAADGAAAALLRREVIASQHKTDGGSVESVYITTFKKLLVRFQHLTGAEATKMESFLDWAVKGNPFAYQPDKDSANALRCVLEIPRGIDDVYEWITRPEVSYGELTFVEQTGL